MQVNKKLDNRALQLLLICVMCILLFCSVLNSLKRGVGRQFSELTQFEAATRKQSTRLSV